MNRKQILFLAAGASTALATQALAQSGLDSARARHDQLLADSELRSSALQPDAAVNVNGQIQFRYLINQRDEVPGGEEDTAVGFQTRRTKLAVSGELTEGWSYKVQGGFDRGGGGSFMLEDAYFDFDAGDGWTVRGGQFKFGVLREELVSSKRQLAAERSVVNEVFNQGRGQGIQANYATENYQLYFGFSDGLRTANSDFTSSMEADYALNGRFEYMWAGEWDRFSDFTSWRGSEFAGMFGVAAHFQDGGSTFATMDTQILILTADVSAEGNGWNAYGALVYSMLDDNTTPMGFESDDFGIVGQGGYFLTDQWEIFGRWDGIFGDEFEDFHSITAGVNYYMIPESHSAKFTADFVYFIDEQDASLADPMADPSLAPASTGIPLLASSEDSQFSIRLQFQLLF